MKKVLLVSSIMVMMAFASSAFAVTTYTQWSGTGAGVGNWTDSTWSVAWGHAGTDNAGVLGNPDYKVGFKTNNYPDLSSGTYSADILVFGGANASRGNNLVLNGATINVSQYVTVAAGIADNGVVTINSGVINTGMQYSNSKFFVTQGGAGVLNMNGGTINIGVNYPTNANLCITDTNTVATGTLNLNNGYIYANDLLKGSGIANMIITNGQLFLKTDRVTEINGYVTAGWLRTTNQGGSVVAVYDSRSNMTQVYATPEPATVALLGLGSLALLRRNKK